MTIKIRVLKGKKVEGLESLRDNDKFQLYIDTKKIGEYINENDLSQTIVGILKGQ